MGLLVKNEDQRPRDYKEMDDIPRPSHADYTYQEKYGVRASSGGGRSSARETIGRVAAGAIAEKWLKETSGIEIIAYVSAVGDCSAPRSLETSTSLTRQDVDKHTIRCPDTETALEMERIVRTVRDEHDSIGGVVTCIVRNLPTGLGEPCFDKVWLFWGLIC